MTQFIAQQPRAGPHIGIPKGISVKLQSRLRVNTEQAHVAHFWAEGIRSIKPTYVINNWES